MSSWLDWFRPSRRLTQFLQRVGDRLAKKYYEGPDPPNRIDDRVKLFMLFNPQADKEQWEQFARTLAKNCYREGFVRGYQWVERCWGGPEVDPEQLAEKQAYDWRVEDAYPQIGRMLQLGYDPNDVFATMPVEQRRAFLDLMVNTGRQYPIHFNLRMYEDDDGNPGFRQNDENDDD